MLHVRPVWARDSLGLEGIVVFLGSEDDATLEEPLSELERPDKRGGWQALTGLPAEAVVQAVEEVPIQIRLVTTKRRW